MVLRYYKSDQSVLRIKGGTPFVATNHLISLDVVLSQWLCDINRRFPPNLLAQANTFRDIWPQDWAHIFQGTVHPDDGLDGSPGRGRPISRECRRGDPDREASRSFAYNLLEKVPGHADAIR